LIRIHKASALLCSAVLVTCCAAQFANESNSAVLTGKAAFTDVTKESPGTRRNLTVADLPDPAPEQSAVNGPTSYPAQPVHGLLLRRASRWSCTPRDSTTIPG
jgi:hypothetical protein